MRLLFVASLALALFGASPAPSPSSSPIELAQSRIDAMLRTGHADPAWFSASFLTEIPASKVDEVMASLIKTLGAYQRVEYTPEKFVAHFAKGTDDVFIHLNADNKIDGLLFKPPFIAASSLDDAVRSLQRQPGTLSYVVVEEGRSELAALNASAPLAVGSAFKLAVLNGVLDQIHQGSRHWRDVVPLNARWKSLPSGILRDWPDGTPLTLATYAAEMISISDNTAADALTRIVGARALKPYAGGNDPFLTTREAFIMKSDKRAELRSAYLAAVTPSARAAVLQRVGALPLPGVAQISSRPQLAIEWHYSVRELCNLMGRVADLPLMSINPGVADPSKFRRVAYKGGSDAGVINLTTNVTTLHGRKICFSATLNNSEHAVDESSFEIAYSAVLSYLESR
jgi:hypothetical protein